MLAYTWARARQAQHGREMLELQEQNLQLAREKERALHSVERMAAVFQGDGPK